MAKWSCLIFQGYMIFQSSFFACFRQAAFAPFGRGQSKVWTRETYAWVCLKIGEPNIRKFASGFLFMPLHWSVGVLLDLLQCEQATDQPQLSWETSLRPKARTFYSAGSSRRLRKVWCCGQKHRRILASSGGGQPAKNIAESWHHRRHMENCGNVLHDPFHLGGGQPARAELSPG